MERGEWKAQSYVIETHEAYPKKLCFDVFGADRMAQFNIQSGEEILVSFDIDAHEYQGRWFNSIRAWNVQRVDPNAVGAMGGMQPGASAFPPMGAAPAQPAPAAAPAAGATAPFPPAQPAAPAAGGSADDLPF